MKSLTGPTIGLHFMRHNSVVIDTTHGLIHFPHLTMQVKSASNGTGAKSQAVFLYDSITVPPIITKKSQHLLNTYRNGIQQVPWLQWKKIPEAARLIISHSISTKIDRKIAVRVNNTKESPHTINKNRQIADFSVVTLEQSKFNKPVDTAFLSMIPEGDPDLTTYLTELRRTTRSAEQNILVSNTRKIVSISTIIPQFRHES